MRRSSPLSLFAFTPLLAPTAMGQEAPVFDRFGNPFPAPLDGPAGVALLEAGGWILLAAGVALLLLPLAKRLAAMTPTDLDKHLLAIVGKPVFIAIAAYGLVDAAQNFALPSALASILAGAWRLLLVGLVTYVVYRVWHEVILAIGRKVSAKTASTLDDKLYPFFSKVGGVIIVLVGLFFAADAVGINPAIFAAGGALVSLVIAFAAQDTLGNFFAGVQILLDQPFREGDRIEIRELETWGDVVDIGLRTTRIRTRDNRTVIVPNAAIASNAVVNHSYPDTLYRNEIFVGVAYGTDIELARETIRGALQTVQDLEAERPVDVLFWNFGDSSLDFRVRWWMRDFRGNSHVRDKAVTAIERALREGGVEIPFPQRDVHMHSA